MTKYYQALAQMPAFTFKEAAEIIGSKERTAKTLSLMIKEGSLHRIRQNLYTCVNFAVNDDYASRFQIASKITEDSFLSYHSAFEFYGFYNQIYSEVQICSQQRFLNFSYADFRYHGYQTASLIQVKTIKGVRVASIERTIIDSIQMLGKVMDMEELVKCLSLVHHVDEEKLLEILSVYDREILYRKAGYILSFFREEFSLSDNFFSQCKAKGIVSNKGYLVSNDRKRLIYSSEWGLYAYGNLKELSYKGGNIDV